MEGGYEGFDSFPFICVLDMRSSFEICCVTVAGFGPAVHLIKLDLRAWCFWLFDFVCLPLICFVVGSVKWC